jgi:hypothetical protein
MVPNHTGIDSRWVVEHPGRFLQLPDPPFPTYNYNCGNLSGRDDITVQIEEHYFTRSDAAVVFKRTDNRTGEVRYIYHGNDGTSMPWNDTAQIDFLNPEAREAVIATIVGVCKQFPIVRFDAAMTLAKRHIQRLWYPEPGRGGDIASRAEHALTNEEFNRRIPNEFWREVVDRCAVEAPNTLLLAEAFWMMEGYFVRTLGMHRVYNSAFMNMLKMEENAKYRATIKNTLEFDPEILKRFVNFMNNPDEDTAAAQFGKGDKYLGICTLLVTMPGLPMFGHGQIEGFEEKYGMEYRRSYKDERPDQWLVEQHEQKIFPLMKRRALFSGSSDFRIYDLYSEGGSVNENVFAYTNRLWDDRALILYNNSFYEASGWIRQSSPAIPQTDGSNRQDTLSEALSIHNEAQYFTLFREQRSNLWYIRSSKDLSERGLFAALKGYEAQVYLDIHDVEDDARGRWARLNNDLKGQGVPDLEAAIMDIYLGELYYRFAEILKPELIEPVAGSKSIDSAQKLVDAESARFIEAFEEPVLAFVKTAKFHIAGAEGKYEPWSPVDGEGKPLEYSEIDDSDIVEIFGETVKRIITVLSESYSPESVMAAMVYSAVSLLRPIIGKGARGKDAAALAFGHWGFARKLWEILHGLGSSEKDAWKVVDIMQAILERTAPDDTAAYKGLESTVKAGNLAAAIILENYTSDDFRRILGVNRFNEVTWFNKEGFEDALFFGSLFYSIETDAAGRKLVGEVAAEFRKAEKVSAYRLDELMEALHGGKAKKDGKKPGKKPGA